jgi:oxygen-independent coproporphyrinogen-3 oxidase
MEGLDLEKTDSEARKILQSRATKYFEIGLMRIQNNHLILTRNGKLLADGIAAALFF